MEGRFYLEKDSSGFDFVFKPIVNKSDMIFKVEFIRPPKLWYFKGFLFFFSFLVCLGCFVVFVPFVIYQ